MIDATRSFGRAIPALAAVIAFAVSGCSGHSGSQTPSLPPGDVVAADHVVIVAGTHANSPHPILGAGPIAAVTAAMTAGGEVQVVHVSGHPSFDRAMRLQQVTGTDAGKEALIKGNLKRIGDAMGRGPADDGADLLESVAMAADSLHAARSVTPVIVVTDSGLTDSGRLRLTADGMLGADPNEVAKYLGSTGALPSLDRVTVYLSGMGYSTVPQEPLDAPTRSRVAQIWQQVFTAAGARVITDTTPNTDGAVTTSHTVQPVALPAPPAQPPVCARTDIVFDSQSQVSFVAETTTYVNAEAATAALRPVASWLAANPRRTALIRGTTANDGSDPARLHAPWWPSCRRGRRRPDRFGRQFRSAHSHRRRVRLSRVRHPRHRPYDRPAAPGPAALNRSVRITLDDHC